jgi:hypothetical protein
MFGNIKSVEWKGGLYKGSVISNSIPHGRGEILYSNGDFYKGEWKLGYSNGNGECKGKFGFSEEFIYVGEFKNNNFHGNGIFTWSNSDYYEGEFKGKYIINNSDNKLNGKG